MFFIYSSVCLKCLLKNSPGSTLLKSPREWPLGNAISRDDSELPSRDCATFPLFSLQTVFLSKQCFLLRVLLSKGGQ